MNGTKPKFLEEAVLEESYYQPADPYQNPKPTKLNLLEMSRYAETQGKKVAELTKEEIEQFRV